MIEILKEFDRTNNQITSSILTDLITEHATVKNKMLDLYNRYTVQSVPIMDRTFDDTTKTNRQLNNAFDVEIIDTKVGYFAGYPISYQLDETDIKQDLQNKVISDFNVRNNIADLDAETVKYSAMCGVAGRLLYIDKEGKDRAMLLYPWEVIPIYDRSINDLQYAIRYYDVTFRGENEAYTVTRAEWYDSENITFFIQDSPGGQFILDDTEPINPMPHLFDGIPIIMFPNNDEMQGDAEKVLELIDGYDRTVSDVNSEIEDFRLAYLVFYGYEPTAEIIEAAKRTGAFGMDVKSEGVSVEYLTKTVNDTVIENHLNRLEANIMRFAKSVNMTDESFAGNLSGVAIRYKLMALENKCITLERKFTSALQQQFKLLSTIWAKKGIALDYLNVYFTFKRNIPVNLTDEADSTGKLKGMVSERTRLGLLSFVDDVDYELEEMEKDGEGMLSLDDEMGLKDTEDDQQAQEPEPGAEQNKNPILKNGADAA